MEKWRKNGLGLARILFGFIWAIDAYFKWQPSFVSGFSTYLSGALDGQPALVRDWIGFWINVVQVNPVFFAHLVALAETALALALIFGVFSNLAYLGGSLLALVIWSTAEGLGGPYTAGSTDIGSAIIYVFVFAMLFLARAGRNWGLDRWIGPRLNGWAFLASGQPPAHRVRGHDRTATPHTLRKAA